MLDRRVATVPQHFHIRWLPSGKLDWERHDARDQAEEAAKQLSRRDEGYAIEQFHEPCRQCTLARSIGSATRTF